MFTVSESSEGGTASADKNYDYYSSLSIEEQHAYRMDLDGDVVESEGELPLEGSCESIALTVTGTPLEDQAIMTELRRMYQAATQSIEYLSALDEWRACLSARGYEIGAEGHPSDLLMLRVGAGTSPEQLGVLEIEMAVADFECALLTSMPVLHRLETELVQELVEKYPEWGS